MNADTLDVLQDEIDSPKECNLYSYCFNNPVNLIDDDGTWPEWATKVMIGTAVIAAAAVLTVATAGTGTAVACFAVGALKGAISGAVVGAATGAAEGAIVHRVTTGSWHGAGKSALKGAADGYASGAISGFVAGGLTSNVCFVAGTAILTATGQTAIENIRQDDLVWSMNPETGETALKTVVRTFENETTELVHVFAGGEEIIATPEHPFYVPTKGWTGAVHLRAGDVLVLVDGSYLVVEWIQHEILESPIKVYNFEVEDFHTYFVGELPVLVHNLCHGNSLKSTKKAELYVLRDQDTHVVKKIGETTRGTLRYTKNYYTKHNVYMQPIASGSKRSMHYSQHRLLKAYFAHSGRLPKLNKSLW